MWRLDHQLSSKHTWAFRWLRESAPQFNRLDGAQETLTSYGDETDLDQTMVGHADLGSDRHQGQHHPIWSRARKHRARESGMARAQARIRALRAVPGRRRRRHRHSRADPRLRDVRHPVERHDGLLRSRRGHSIDNTFSWFIPEAKGRHDLKFGARYSHIWLSNPAWGNLQGTYQFRGTGDTEFNASNPRSYPERFTIRAPGALDYNMIHAHRRVVRAGQVADEARPHAERRRPVRHRSVPVRPGAARQSGADEIPDRQRATSRRASAWSGTPMVRASRLSGPATGSSTTEPCSEPSTTS